MQRGLEPSGLWFPPVPSCALLHPGAQARERLKGTLTLPRGHLCCCSLAAVNNMAGTSLVHRTSLSEPSTCRRGEREVMLFWSPPQILGLDPGSSREGEIPHLSLQIPGSPIAKHISSFMALEGMFVSPCHPALQRSLLTCTPCPHPEVHPEHPALPCQPSPGSTPLTTAVQSPLCEPHLSGRG